MNTRLVYAVLAVQTVILGYLVISPMSLQPTAMAQGVPDQGAQLQQIIDDTHAMNAKLERVVQVLEGGKLQVRVAPEQK